MEDNRVLKCQNCGAVLEIRINESVNVCKYCGSRNLVESQQMKTETSIGGMKVSANTDTENFISSIEYAISSENYEKADELILLALMSGKDDYRVHIEKCKLDMIFKRDQQLFETLRKIRRLVGNDISREEAEDLSVIMRYRDRDGMTALHIAAYHLYYDMVKFCVEAGSDVNAVAGPRSVSPITIMYTNVSPHIVRYDGAPLTHNKKNDEGIRAFLMQRGAKAPTGSDVRRAKTWIYNRSAIDSDANSDIRSGRSFQGSYGMSQNGMNVSYTKPVANGTPVNKVIYCALALFLGVFGIQKFYSKKIGAGVLCFIFSFTYIPTIIGFVDFLRALTKKADASGNIYIK